MTAEKAIKEYYKDPDLKGVYVKRCKCGARPYLDRIPLGTFTVWWIACNCGSTGKGDKSKQTAIDNWNNDKLE